MFIAKGTLDLLLPGKLLQDQDQDPDHDRDPGPGPDHGQGQDPQVVEDQGPEVVGGSMPTTLGIRFMSLVYLQESLKETLRSIFPRRAR